MRSLPKCRQAARATTPWFLMALAACAPQGDAATTVALPREGRFGSLRDFVLFERGAPVPGGALFVDRFEVTRADWLGFAATPAGRAVAADLAATGGDPALPVGQVDLSQARAFARWRFARLPRLEEWQFAALGDGRNRFPWGSKEDATRTNTGELGLGEPTPAGTFESGRRSGGDQPYDLVGNVSEWTESVPWSWCVDELEDGERVLDPRATLRAGRLLTLRAPAAAVWQWPAGMLPVVFAAQAGGERVPREVVGADFLTAMSASVEPVMSGDRRVRTGLRLYATPRELLLSLLAFTGQPSALEQEQVRRFLRRGRHREVITPVWRRLDGDVLAAGLDGAGPLARLLGEELGARTGGPEDRR